MKRIKRYLTPPRKYKKKNYKNSSNCNGLLFGLVLLFFFLYFLNKENENDMI
jgi:hypothetical protein